MMVPSLAMPASHQRHLQHRGLGARRAGMVVRLVSRPRARRRPPRRSPRSVMSAGSGMRDVYSGSWKSMASLKPKALRRPPPAARPPAPRPAARRRCSRRASVARAQADRCRSRCCRQFVTVSVADVHGARGVVDGIGGGHVVLQSGGQRHHLEGGSGGVQGKRGSVEHGAVVLGVAFGRCLQQLAEPGGVVGGGGGHRQHGTRFRVQHHAGPHVALKGVLGGLLDGGVDGERDVVAVDPEPARLFRTSVHEAKLRSPFSVWL